jgi:hypothetical protein
LMNSKSGGSEPFADEIMRMKADFFASSTEKPIMGLNFSI